MFLDKKLLRKMDMKLLLSVTAIIIISLIVIGSATHVNTPSEERYWFVQRQGMFALINAGVAIFLMNFDYKMLQRYGQKMYIFNLVMLLAVMFVGQSALGAQRWIQLGPITLQPSEFSKIIMIVSLAALLQEKVGKLNTLSDLLPVAAYVGVPFLLVMKQPDLGTSLVFMAIFFGMIFACGINLKLLAGIFGTGIACLPLLWHVLKDYQKMRIMVFLDPNVDRQRNIRQVPARTECQRSDSGLHLPRFCPGAFDGVGPYADRHRLIGKYIQREQLSRPVLLHSE